MPVAVPPVVLLALLLILLTTQVSYLAAPRAPHYLVRLALSTLAVLLGEGISLLGPGARLAVGELHPVADLVLVVGLQWAGTRLLRRQPV
ncbi:MAG TPA: hypothetical protein VHW91_08980 [Candidatus Dormibacteraeota bacterium]|nr:hypothetical protein [Candidatus Dormibacteraeota bacterium]